MNKLDPLSGGQGGEREGALGKTTSAAKQGTNPYLHKNMEDEELLENLESNEEDDEDVDENELDENEVDENEADEIADEELGGMYGKSADGAILNLLKDVKGLLESRHMEKAAMSDIRVELDEIKKSMPTTIEAGIKSGMKGFGYTPTAGEMKRVKPQSKRSNKVSGHQTIRKSSASAPSAPIGVEGDSLANLGAGDAMSAGEAQQGQFVDAVETILKSNDTDDLRGTFKKVNSMRDQQGDVAPSTLYYHKAGGS